LLSGLFPACQTTRPDVQQSLKEGAVKSRRSHRLRNALIVGDVAVSLVLLVGAGLLLRSVWNWQRIDLGFDPNGTVTMWLNLPAYKYRGANEAEHFSAAVLQRLQNLPGVQQAAARICSTHRRAKKEVSALRWKAQRRSLAMMNPPFSAQP
jgi:hypothetical protein